MEAKTRVVANQMVTMMNEDPALLQAVKSNPEVEIPKLIDAAVKQLPAYMQDKWLYRMAIAVLGLLALIAAVGSIVLVVNGKVTPEVLVALGSAAVGALVGLFATPPATS
jgi:hypothetical protein